MIRTEVEGPNANLLQLADLEANPARPEETGVEEAAQESPGHRLVPLLAWAAVILTLILVPLNIISQGYLPPDDALRHAGKAVSGRDWTEILVMQDEFKIDHNPGWHWILGRVHQATGASTEALVIVSVCALVGLFFLIPLGWLRYPEAWVATLLASMIIFPGLLFRVFLGRPFVLTMAATMVILLMWRKRAQATPIMLAVSTALIAVATWAHGSWYLFALLVAAFGLAGQWRAAIQLGGCWLAGSFLGALLTGHPIAFLWNAINIGISCFGNHELQRMLVTEFRASDGAPMTLALVAAMLIFRRLSGAWSWNVVNNPIFILFLLGWILGFRVARFYDDWASPALGIWMALEFHGHFQRHLGMESFRRLAIVGALCAAFFFCITGDLHSRWTNNLMRESLVESDPEMKPWLPDDGGIIYAADMRVFYDTFFKNPHAKWKYVLGFESTFMLPEDLKIYRNLQRNFLAHKGYEPWVAKMRPADRMVISGGSSAAPAVPGLEWKYVARETWIGRLPRG